MNFEFYTLFSYKITWNKKKWKKLYSLSKIVFCAEFKALVFDKKTYFFHRKIEEKYSKCEWYNLLYATR